MAVAAARVHRKRYLGSSFDELESAVRSAIAESGARPMSFRVGASELTVDSFEWEALVEWARAPRRSDWHLLVVEGLAFVARSRADLEAASDPATAAGAAGAAGAGESPFGDLQFDAVFGFKLMADLQAAVERMVLKGRMDLAKKLTQFRHRVNDTVAELGRLIGEAALREAEGLAAAAPRAPLETGEIEVIATGDVATTIEELFDLEAQLEKKVDQDDARTAESPPVPIAPPKRSVSPRLVLASVLAALILVWVFFVGLPVVTHKPLRSFALADFQTLPAVRDVLARPPSLFVTVDENHWRALSEEERRRTVEEVAKILEPEGYTGARFATGTGGTLAQWLKQGGVRLTDLSKPRS